MIFIISFNDFNLGVIQWNTAAIGSNLIAYRFIKIKSIAIVGIIFIFSSGQFSSFYNSLYNSFHCSAVFKNMSLAFFS